MNAYTPVQTTMFRSTCSFTARVARDVAAEADRGRIDERRRYPASRTARSSPTASATPASSSHHGSPQRWLKFCSVSCPRMKTCSCGSVRPSASGCDRAADGLDHRRVPSEPRRVLLQHERPHLVLERRRLEVGEPAVGRDQREVRAEQHLRPELGVRVLDELRREVLRRPAGQVDPHVRPCAGRSRSPRPARGTTDGRARSGAWGSRRRRRRGTSGSSTSGAARRHRGRPCRCRCAPSGRAPARPPRRSPRRAGRRARSFGKKAWRFGWNLKPFAPAAARARTRSTASGRAGSTLANGMITSGFCAAASRISSFGIGGDPAARLPVDREQDGGHVRARGSRRRRRRPSAAARRSRKYRRGRRAQLGRHRVVPVARALGVHVDVDRGDGGEVDHGDTVPSSSCSAAPHASRSQSEPGAPISETLTGSPLRRADAGRQRDDREARPVPVVRQRDLVEVAERLLVAAAARRARRSAGRLDDRVDPVLDEPVAPGVRVLDRAGPGPRRTPPRSSPAARRARAGRGSSSGTSSRRSSKRRCQTSISVSTHVEELGEDVEASRAGAAARPARPEAPRARARTRRRRQGRGRPPAGRRAHRRSGRRSGGATTPAIAASSGSQSRTVRAIGPGWSKVGASGTIPRIESSPRVGLIVDVPHSAEGMRSEPAVSVPVAAGTCREASAALGAAARAAGRALERPGVADLVGRAPAGELVRVQVAEQHHPLGARAAPRRRSRARAPRPAPGSTRSAACPRLRRGPSARSGRRRGRARRRRRSARRPPRPPRSASSS